MITVVVSDDGTLYGCVKYEYINGHISYVARIWKSPAIGALAFLVKSFGNAVASDDRNKAKEVSYSLFKKWLIEELNNYEDYE